MRKYTVIARQPFLVWRGNLFNGMKLILVLIALVSFSCSENPETLIEHIEGYWEIEEVTLANGQKKQYQFNETIDYIKVNDSLKGFRKKLKPGINDTYFTSDDAESLIIKIENNELNMYYRTPYAKWKETVLDASDKHLKIKNENKDVYLYKRYTPIQLDVE